MAVLISLGLLRAKSWVTFQALLATSTAAAA
jgi:hypothetical protein